MGRSGRRMGIAAGIPAFRSCRVSSVLDTSSASPAPLRAYASWRLILTRIHRVSQTVPDEGETEHRQGDGQRRKESEIPVDADVLRAVGDHFTKTRRRLVDTDAEEAQAGLGKDRGRDG